MTATQLPTFKGYTIDFRLKEFRKAIPHYYLEFISFYSPEGEALLGEFIDTLDPNTPDGLRFLIAIWFL